MKNRSDEEAVRCYKDMYDFLDERNCKPKLNIMDNEASRALRRFITRQRTKYQLVEPNNHRVNATERAIRTFKNHFVAGLSSVHPQFPLYLWDELLPQAEITLNLLRSSRTCPKMSAHAHLHGIFNYNATPLAPPGCQALIYEDPTHRRSFGTHGVSAYYIGPAMEHYRNYQFFVPSSGGKRICATAQFFPSQGSTPIATPTENVLIAAHDLIEAIKQPSHLLTDNISNRHLSALKVLSGIFNNAAQQTKMKPAPPTTVNAQHQSQVPIPTQTTPNTPTVMSRDSPTSSQEDDEPRPAPNAIPYNDADVAQRPSTHRYPTRTRSGAHIINEMIQEHAINIVLSKPADDSTPSQTVVWDSEWIPNSTPKNNNPPPSSTNIRPSGPSKNQQYTNTNIICVASWIMIQVIS